MRKRPNRRVYELFRIRVAGSPTSRKSALNLESAFSGGQDEPAVEPIRSEDDEDREPEV